VRTWSTEPVSWTRSYALRAAPSFPARPGQSAWSNRRALIELGHFLEAPRAHVQLHEELPGLGLLQQELGLGRGQLLGQLARRRQILPRQGRAERRANVASGLEEPGCVGEGTVPVVQPGGVAGAPA
jgi:hypothetical protein